MTLVADIPAPAPDAAAMVAGLTATLDSLAALIARETELVRRARLGEAATLAPQKRDLVVAYLAGLESVRRSRPDIACEVPQEVERLRGRHDALRAVVDTNLAVLGTARAVAESLIRDVVEEMARQRAPTVYGRSGGMAKSARPGPIALSRML
jgi:hypothetical protein